MGKKPNVIKQSPSPPLKEFKEGKTKVGITI